VRDSKLGIAASVTRGAGTVVISGNMIAGATQGAIVGMDFKRVVGGDLAHEPTRFAHLQISGNRVR
jgi:hypothetical protein